MKCTFGFSAAVIIALVVAVFAQAQDTGTHTDQVTTETHTKSKNTAEFDTKTSSDATESETDIVKRLDNSAAVLNEVMGTPDKGIPTNVLADAKCLAVIPSMINIAVGFGGRHGKGV